MRNRIERAKGMLMMQEGIDDAAAFERLRVRLDRHGDR